MNRRNRTADSKRTSRRVGYVVAIGVNVALMVIANNLLDWGWFPWLTADLEKVLPIINASLIVAIVVNAAYLAYEPPWFRSVGELAQLVVSLIATARLFRVFPFDFSAYEFGWGTLTRGILVAAIFGVCVAMVVHLARLAVMARDLVEEEAASVRAQIESDTD